MSTDIRSSNKTFYIPNSIVQNMVWMISVMTNLKQNDKSNQHLSTWAADNSFICERKNKTRASVMRLHPKSPTDRSVQYSVLKHLEIIHEMLWVLGQINNCRPWVI